MSSKTKTVIAGLFGNALEWYDFTLYANFSPIIAKLFFPTDDPITSLLLAFLVFATGFFIRPFGGMFFGYISDHFGRRTALIGSICTISIPTFLMAFIPSYATIGIMAPVILTLLRLLQGLAVSGELNTATTFLVEYANDNQRGLAGSLVMVTAFLGILFGALVSSSVTSYFPSASLENWGWRVPFLIGGVIGIIGLIIRIQIKESPKFQEEKTPEKVTSSFKNLLLHFPREIVASTILTMITAVGEYILIVFVIVFLVDFQGFSLRDANLINFISIFAMIILFPIMGYLSDKFGRKTIFRLGLLGFVLLSYPIFWLFSQKIFIYALVGDLLLALILSPLSALIPTVLAELFPMRVRNSGSALAYNLSLALFGGTTPLVSLKLIEFTGTNYGPAFYLIVCALLSLVALYFIKESHDKPLL